jgi:hypothetical protein
VVVIKESTEEVAGREAESALKEGGKYHIFIRIGCRKIFTSSRAPLQHGAVQEKVVRNKFVKSFAKVRNQCERGDRDSEEEEEKWWWHEKWLGLAAGSLFNSDSKERICNGPPGCT